MHDTKFWMQLWTPSWCADPPPWTTRSICAWTEATTTQRARPQCATTNTSVTLASVPDSLLMRQTRSGIRRGVGLSNAPSRGCRSSEAFWSDTRCMTRTTSGYCNSRALSSGPASGTLSKHRPLIEIGSKRETPQWRSCPSTWAWPRSQWLGWSREREVATRPSERPPSAPSADSANRTRPPPSDLPHTRSAIAFRRVTVGIG